MIVAETSSVAADAPGAVARHHVRDQIEELILTGAYQPGARLIQQKLAKQFGVSQNVVRESLFELSAFGLVDLTDRLGARVAQVTEHMLLQARDVRQVHEGLAARECCRHASRAEIEALEALARQVDILGLEGRIQEMAVLDRDFHRNIVVFSRNEVLLRLIDTFRILGKAVWMYKPGRTISPEHAGLVVPIRENRPDEAEQMMRQHIARGTRSLAEQFADGTFTLEPLDG